MSNTFDALFSFSPNHPYFGINNVAESTYRNKTAYGFPTFPRLYTGSFYAKKAFIFSSISTNPFGSEGGFRLDKFDREIVINLGCKKIKYTWTRYSTSYSSEYTFLFDSPIYQLLGNNIAKSDYYSVIDYSFFSGEEFNTLFNYFKDTFTLDIASSITWIKENVTMPDSILIKEIHACLGAGEFAYYNNSGTPTPYVMHIARNIDFLMKSFGIYYNPDGYIQSVVLNPAPPESEP